MRRVAWGVLGTLLVAVSASCGDERSTTSSSTAKVEGVALPFGLEVIDGTEPIGRPAVYEQPAFFYKGQPVHSRRLRAAFWVTAEDPVAVVRAWAAQLDRLSLERVSVRRGDSPPPQWMEVSGSASYVGDQPPGDSADLELWATSRDPVLLVSIDKVRGDPRRPQVDDDAGNPPAPSAEVEDASRREGDTLFTEQGDAMHLPEGSETLVPTIPTFGGTGGSTSVFSAPDGGRAVSALLDEAQAHSGSGEVSGPTRSETDGVQVVTGSFVIPAGGWGFDVVAVRAPNDPFATVYVVSYAD